MAQTSQLSANTSQLSASKPKPRGRGPGRPFQKGQSGNPGGKNRAFFDVQALAREHTPQAIATLVRALTSEREAVAVNAAVHLLDRAWGRPLAPVTLDGAERISSIVLNIVSARERSLTDANPSDRSAGGMPPPRVITITSGEDD